MPNLPNKKCACCGANLDRFLQPVILSIIAKEPCNGYTVIKKIPEYATFTESGADPTGVYRYLKIMLNKGLISPTSNNNGDLHSNIYSITEDGLVCLSNWAHTLNDYTHKIRQLLTELPPEKEDI